MLSPEEKAFSNALEVAKNYVGIFLNHPIAELSGILSDTIGYWRLKNQVRLILKAKEWLDQRGVNPTKVLPDIFVPLLEDGGNVENQTLSESFASLLACHIDPGKQELIHPSYTRVLAQMSPLDAKIIQQFRTSASYKKARELGLRGAPLTVEFVADEMNLPMRTIYMSCLNLERLGIIKHMGFVPPEEHPMPNIFENSMEHQRFLITEYGIAFYEECHYYPRNGNK